MKKIIIISVVFIVLIAVVISVGRSVIHKNIQNDLTRAEATTKMNDPSGYVPFYSNLTENEFLHDYNPRKGKITNWKFTNGQISATIDYPFFGSVTATIAGKT